MASLCVAGGIAGCSLLAVWKARQFIQGYWFDRNSPGPHDNLTDCIVVVTGGSSGGLGCAGAILLAELGADIIITTRSEAKGAAAVQEIRQYCRSELQKVHYVVLDLCSSASIHAASEVIKQKCGGRLDVLVLNAGSNTDSAPEVWQGNYLGHFLLVELLRPLLESTSAKHGFSRIVAVSSGAHKRATIAWDDPFDNEAGKYGQSKLAQVMHMRELQRRSPALRCVSVTPGLVATNLVSSNLGGMGPLLRCVAQCVLLPVFARSLRTGAQVIKMGAAAAVPGGCYLSNCYEKPAEGKDGVANDPAAWTRLWELSERQVAEKRFP